MLMLCDGTPKVKAIGERLRLTVPSGTDDVEIDMSLNHALRLREALRRVTEHEFLFGFASTPATVLRFPKSRKARGA